MKDAFIVGELKRVTNLRDNIQRLLGRELPRAHGLAQVHSVYEFHEKVEIIARLPKVVKRHDVRVVEILKNRCFSRETIGESLVGRETGWQDFEGGPPIEVLLAGLLDRSHATSTGERFDLQLGKRLGDLFQTRNVCGICGSNLQSSCRVP
jgi:hypothetical protein